MPAFLPEELALLFMERFNARDLGGVSTLFESEGTIVAQPGQPVSGTRAIQDALATTMGNDAKLHIEVLEVIRAADLALLRSHWKLEDRDSNGKAVHLEGHGVEVVRRQPDGTWLYAIDHPYGVKS
jgi:ketosteroid isomerase-like protein